MIYKNLKLPAINSLADHIAHVAGIPRDKAKRIINEMINWFIISMLQNGGFYLPRFGRVFVARIVDGQYGKYGSVVIKVSRKIANSLGEVLSKHPLYIEDERKYKEYLEKKAMQEHNTLIDTTEDNNEPVDEEDITQEE